MQKTLHAVLASFGLEEKTVIRPYGNGLINSTWKLESSGTSYILQKVNHHVFKKPEDIAHNIRSIADYLKEHHPSYLFIAPLPSKDGKELVKVEEDYYRLFPFVSGSYSIDTVQNPEQAYEAAGQFGKFTRLLSGFDITRLKITIPSFHDLSLRHQQFLQSIKEGKEERIREATPLIRQLLDQEAIVTTFSKICTNSAFLQRVTHHDTKISNVLFDPSGKGLCVIDLDTVMPGYFISDVGDMMRTYLCPVSEEETDLGKVIIRDEFYQAIVTGYYDQMKEILTEEEKGYFFYSGLFLIYMQSLRFLSDYLNGDVYYPIKRPSHNLDRAKNQITLLKELRKKENLLKNKARI